MNHYVIQAMRPRDTEEILDIEKESFSSPWTREMFLGELSNPLGKAFVARRWDIGTSVLGYLFYQVVAFEMHILNIAVHPSFRSQKIGKTLLVNSLEKEKNNDAARYVYLEVRDNNNKAIQMYTKAGFKQIGVRKKFYVEEGDNALILGRPIG